MVYVYDHQLKGTGVFREVEDLKARNKELMVGSFSFKVPFTLENMNTLKPDHFIDIRSNNVSGAVFQGVIETVYIDKEVGKIEVSGKSLEALLDWKPPYPKLRFRDISSYPGGHYYGLGVEGENIEYYTRNIVFANPQYDTANTYKNLYDLLQEIGYYMWCWYGLVFRAPDNSSSIPDIHYPTNATEIPIANQTILSLLKIVMEKFYPTYTLKFELNVFDNNGGIKSYFVPRENVRINSDSAGISNIVYTNSTSGAVDVVYSEWELGAISTDAQTLISKEGKIGYNRKDSTGHFPYEYQSYITGWTTWTGTIPVSDLYEVNTVIRNGVSKVSGDPARGDYMTCNRTPTVTYRKNDSSGEVIAGPRIPIEVVNTLRSEGVTNIYVAIACGTATSGWGSGNFGGVGALEGTKPLAKVQFTTMDASSNTVQIAYVSSPYIPAGRSQWFDRCLHKSDNGYDADTEIEVKRARLNTDNSGDIEKPSSSYEFVLDPSMFDLSKGAIVQVYDTDFNMSFTKVVSEIEYVFVGEDFHKIYSMTDYIGGN